MAMKAATIQPSTFKFLKDLDKNNNREWFAKNKPVYQQALDNMAQFADALIDEMNKHDVIEEESGKKSLYRIYSDVRFKKDKSPYNVRFACSLHRAGKQRRGSYYLHIKPGKSYLSCGFYGPNPADLQRIRQDMDLNLGDWEKLLKSKGMKQHYSPLTGDAVSTAPRGYAKDHPAIHLIRYKQFFFRHYFTDKEVLAPDFLKKTNAVFKAIRPFLDYMSEVLTTNANGESIL
jgi:uncharacterized protein (TIGR02453 family)